jgi:hypothetical protein
MLLDNGYTLQVIKPGFASPMANHKGGEIAVDEQNKIMYAWETFVICYGLNSIVKSCLSYRGK